MNTKEKAIEIIESFRDGILVLTLFKDKEVLVKCAIIHVKGIIEVLDIYPRHQMTSFEIERLDYWNEVLTELNQM